MRIFNCVSILIVVAINVMMLSGPVAEAAPPTVIDEAPARLQGVEPRLWSATFSPDGKSLAVTAGWENPEEPGELVIWDLASRSQKLIRRQEKPIRNAVFSPDGTLVAICDFAGSTKLLDSATGKINAVLPPHSKLVNSVAFTADGKTLIAGSIDGSITVWDVAAEKEQHTFSLPDEMVVSVAVSSDGRYLGAVTWQGKAHLWDLRTCQKTHELTANKELPNKPGIAEAIAFSPDGKSFVTGCWDTSLQTWDTVSGKTVRELAGHKSSVQNAVYSPSGTVLATSDAQGTVRGRKRCQAGKGVRNEWHVV